LNFSKILKKNEIIILTYYFTSRCFNNIFVWRFLGKKGVFFFSIINTFAALFISISIFMSHLLADTNYVEYLDLGC